jgi:arylsulfatase A-like enzyme
VVAKQKGAFDRGWDELRKQTFARQKEIGVIPANAELTPRPKEIPAWDSLNDSQKKLLSHPMEVYAAFLAQTDYEVGRLLQAIRAEGHLEDTAIFYIVGDNGGSAEGGFEGHDRHRGQQDPTNRTTPGTYRRSRQRAVFQPLRHRLGMVDQHAFPVGQRGGFAPARHARSADRGPGHIWGAGGLRSQFHHVVDIAPTIYELAGFNTPAR